MFQKGNHDPFHVSKEKSFFSQKRDLRDDKKLTPKEKSKLEQILWEVAEEYEEEQ